MDLEGHSYHAHDKGSSDDSGAEDSQRSVEGDSRSRGASSPPGGSVHEQIADLRSQVDTLKSSVAHLYEVLAPFVNSDQQQQQQQQQQQHDEQQEQEQEQEQEQSMLHHHQHQHHHQLQLQQQQQPQHRLSMVGQGASVMFGELTSSTGSIVWNHYDPDYGLTQPRRGRGRPKGSVNKYTRQRHHLTLPSVGERKEGIGSMSYSETGDLDGAPPMTFRTAGPRNSSLRMTPYEGQRESSSAHGGKRVPSGDEGEEPPLKHPKV